MQRRLNLSVVEVLVAFADAVHNIEDGLPVMTL